MGRSAMENAWRETEDQADLTGWRSGYIQKFIRQIGSAYDFLFEDRGAKFVANEKKFAHGNDWAVVTLQAGQLLLRFVRDRGEIALHMAHSQAASRWFDAESLCLLVLFNEQQKTGKSSVLRIDAPPIADVLRDKFAELEIALAKESVENTESTLIRIGELRAAGALDVFHVQPAPGFLSSYS